jgi:hypothetical protein
MPRERDPTADDAQPPCGRQDCDATADFWLYHGDGRWRPICERHAVHHHPSIEVNAWLESGYARPIELDRPEGPPAAPRGGRSAAFRELVAEAMGWSE